MVRRAQSMVHRLEMSVIVDLRRCVLASTLAIAFVVAGSGNSFSQHHEVFTRRFLFPVTTPSSSDS